MSETPQRTAQPRPAATSKTLVNGQRGVMQTVWDTRTRPPTFTQPQLAVILVPKTIPGARVGGGGGGFAAAATATADQGADQGWVFPVSKPLVRESQDDNQALLFNTTDNTAEYTAVFAMVWIEDGRDAMNVNEAQAYASCDSCTAVAVAYQVVFVIDTDDIDDNVAAPQNLAGALNYDCVNCLTYALAQQLFVTLDRPLTNQEMDAIDDIWKQVQALATIDQDGLTPEEIDTIDDQLAAYTAQIKEIVAPAMASTAAPTTALQTASQTSPSTASTAAVTPTASQTSPSSASTAATTPTASPTASSTAIPTPSATVASTASSTASPGPTSSSSPTPSSSSDPTGTTSEPTGTTRGPTDSTSTGTTADGSTPGGTTSDGTSDGSASGGNATSP